jgi:predicted exporter
MTMIRAASAVFAFSALVTIDLVTIAVPQSDAATYRPWCAQYYGRSSATNCGFVSYEQCMATARGAGAYCIQNPWYLAYGPGNGSGRRPSQDRYYQDRWR